MARCEEPEINHWEDQDLTEMDDIEEELENLADNKQSQVLKNLVDKAFDKKHQKVKSKGVTRGKKRTYDDFDCDSLFSDSSDSDDCIMPIKEHKSKIQELEKIIKYLRIKIKILKEKAELSDRNFQTMLQLNIQLQKKILQFGVLHPEVNNANKIQVLPERNNNCQQDKGSDPEVIVDDPEVHVIKCIKKEPESSLNNENDFELDEEILKSIHFRVKPGIYGDSMFVKNLACAVFGVDTLAKSSVTGSKCNSKKDAVAKPALCSKKLEYIKRLFARRLDDEKCSGQEREKRLSKMKIYIAEKIITLNRKKSN